MEALLLPKTPTGVKVVSTQYVRVIKRSRTDAWKLAGVRGEGWGWGWEVGDWGVGVAVVLFSP